MLRIRVEIKLSNEEAAELKRWRRRGEDSRLQFRAALILDYARGLPVTEVAKRHQTSERTVSRWRQRFVDRRLAGLMTGGVASTIRKAGGSGGPNAVAGKFGEAQGALVGVGQAAGNQVVNMGRGLVDAGKVAVKKAVDVGGAARDGGLGAAKIAAKVPGMMAQAVAKNAGIAGGVMVVAGAAGANMAAGFGGEMGHAAQRQGADRRSAQGRVRRRSDVVRGGACQCHRWAGWRGLVGRCVAGVLSAKASENVSIADVGDFMVKHASNIADEVKASASRGREWWPKMTARGLRFHWRPVG